MATWLLMLCFLVLHTFALPSLDDGAYNRGNNLADAVATLQSRDASSLDSNLTSSPEVASIVVLWAYIFPDNATLQAVTFGREFRNANDSSPESGWAQDTLNALNITMIPYVYGTLNRSAHAPGHLVERDSSDFVDLLVRGWKRVGSGARSFVEYIFGLSPKVVSEIYEPQDFSHLEWSTTESDERLLSEQARRRLSEGLSKTRQRPRPVRSRPMRVDSSGSVEEFEPAVRKSTLPPEQQSTKARFTPKAKAEMRKTQRQMQKQAAKERAAARQKLRESKQWWRKDNPELQQPRPPVEQPAPPKAPVDRPPPAPPEPPQSPPGEPSFNNPQPGQPDVPHAPPGQPEVPHSSSD
ncbi:hypothetical protein LTR95_005217 [Oleoguttula sp. CCFEE 5521]